MERLELGNEELGNIFGGNDSTSYEYKYIFRSSYYKSADAANRFAKTNVKIIRWLMNYSDVGWTIEHDEKGYYINYYRSK